MKIKQLGISTGNIFIAVLHKKDASKLGFTSGDRVEITAGIKKIIAIIDISSNGSIVKEGEVGLFDEAFTALQTKNGTLTTLSIVPKPNSIYLISKKLKGEELSKKEIFEIVQDIVDKRLTEVEMTYFVSACYMRELSISETVALTLAMVQTGKTLNFGKKIVADKHCIGGVAGNRTTCLVIPILAAAGITIPKTSSRSITSPAGTSDTMEVLCNVTLSLDEMKTVISKTNGCLVWGGAMDIAPSDDALIKVEHPVSLDPIGQMLASVLAKKKAAGSTHCLIDIPVGKGAKVESKSKAIFLKKRFEEVGKMIGMKVLVEITDGSEPIGNGIGPSLEARDILWTLQKHPNGSKRLEEKAVNLAGKLLELCGKRNGEKLARKIFDSGEAYEKFIEILIAQGLYVKDAEKILVGKLVYEVKAKKSGKVTSIDNKIISRIARMAGAPTSKESGIYLHVHKKSPVKKGDVLFTIYSTSISKFSSVKKFVSTENGIEIR